MHAPREKGLALLTSADETVSSRDHATIFTISSASGDSFAIADPQFANRRLKRLRLTSRPYSQVLGF